MHACIDPFNYTFLWKIWIDTVCNSNPGWHTKATIAFRRLTGSCTHSAMWNPAQNSTPKVHMHTHIHRCTHAYMHTCIHTYIHTYMQACMFACVLRVILGMCVRVYITSAMSDQTNLDWQLSREIDRYILPAPLVTREHRQLAESHRLGIR